MNVYVREIYLGALLKHPVTKTILDIWFDHLCKQQEHMIRYGPKIYEVDDGL